MNEKKKNIDPEIKNLIIETAYESASFLGKMRAEKLMKSNPELKTLYEEYKSTADSVHSLHKEEMPDSVLINTEQMTGTKLSRKSSSFFDDLLSIFYAKPQIAFAATAIVIGFLTFSIFLKNDSSTIDFESSQYTRAEVELANRQAKHALLLVSQVLTTTSNKVADEIIPNRVVKPINESFEYVNDLFKKGDI